MKPKTFSPEAAKKAVGPCPVCGRTDLWLNDVPLKAQANIITFVESAEISSKASAHFHSMPATAQ